MRTLKDLNITDHLKDIAYFTGWLLWELTKLVALAIFSAGFIFIASVLLS